MMEKNDERFVIDDRPPDLSKYDKYTDEEIQQMIDEMEKRHAKILQERLNKN